MANEHRKVRVQIDGGPTYEAYCDNQRWNGWAMPWFTLESARALMNDIPEVKYDEKLDRFTCQFDSRDDIDEFTPVTITVDGQPLKVYGIGAGFWVWDECDEPPAPAPSAEASQ